MYGTIAEFVEEWNRESAISLKVLRVLTDASLNQKVYDEGRTLARLAWHMAIMVGGTGSVLGLEVAAPPRGTEAPSSAKTAADAYEKAARSFAAQVSAKLTDDRLPSEVSFFGRSLPMERVLHTLILHQCHHRGQITVLVRQAGLVPPGVYGPTREEEAARAKQGS
jgi:uncharacterized damage-inducible protein DinB